MQGPNNPAAGPSYGPASRLQQAESTARRRRRGRRVRNRPKRSDGFQFTGKTGTNAVGGLREGQRYRVFSRNGVFYHVYGHGPEARKVRLRPEVARQYGYTGNRLTPGATSPNSY